ncbi:MAG: glycine cleavage system protein GcvH [Pirellulaceae bacterium]|jgi:glycine cleavage system H protein
MTRDPAALRYLASHEWVEAPDSANAGVVAIGISSFAVEQLTDLVYLALPVVGREVKRGDEVGEVESVKAVSTIYSPVSGQIVEVNSQLADQLDQLKDDPYGKGWLVKIRMSDPKEWDGLLEAGPYQAQCDQSH